MKAGKPSHDKMAYNGKARAADSSANSSLAVRFFEGLTWPFRDAGLRQGTLECDD
jgi:hypothetical protein